MSKLMDKLNICTVIPSFYPAFKFGGTIFSSLHTCQELARLGHQIRVSTTNTHMDHYLDVVPNQYLELEDNLLVKYYHDTLLNRFSWPLYTNLHQDIKAADVVHVQAIFNSPTPLALYHAGRYQKPLLLSPRGVLCEWIMHQGIRFKKEWLRFFIRPFAREIFWHATSLQEKEEILHYFPQAQVFVIPNGIDLSAFAQITPYSRKAYIQEFAGIDRSFDKVLVSMGRLHKKKGFDILIRAFKEVLNKYPQTVLLIAGEDEGEKEVLEALIKDLELQQKVFFTGALSGQEKVDFLAYADLFVLPSYNENFGNVYAEALAAGTPIVASTHTPWQEVETYQCGRWVENSIDSVQKAIVECLGQDLYSMGEKAKKYIEKYDWKEIALDFYRIFSFIKRCK